MHHRNAVKAEGEGCYIRIVHIGAQLRQVSALLRASMNVHQHVAMVDNLGKQRVGNAIRQAAVGAAGEVPVEVAAVRQVTAALLKTRQIHNRHTHNSPGQFGRVEVIQGAAHNFDAV